MFSRHLSLHKALLLNYLSTPIITICCFSRSDCNNTLRRTHCCSNESIAMIVSINLFNTRDLENCLAWALLPSIWKQKLSFSWRRKFFDWPMQVSPKLYLCWCCSYKFLDTWWSDTVVIFPWCFKWLSIIVNFNVCN